MHEPIQRHANIGALAAGCFHPIGNRSTTTGPNLLTVSGAKFKELLKKGLTAYQKRTNMYAGAAEVEATPDAGQDSLLDPTRAMDAAVRRAGGRDAMRGSEIYRNVLQNEMKVVEELFTTIDDLINVDEVYVLSIGQVRDLVVHGILPT